MACGRLMCLQLGQGWIWTSASARWERRRPFLDLDSLTFGRATARKVYGKPGSRRGTLVFCCLVLGFFGGRLVRLQGLHPTPHGGQCPAEMRLELLQLFQGVRLCLADDLV